jgi:hypothetical protein
MPTPRPTGFIALLTDFGGRDPYVGVMKGMVLRAHPKAVLVDLGHDVPPQDTSLAGFWLAAAIGRFPAGTVHLAVVDPGVGTSRRLLCACAHEAFWLAPDNGLLTEVLAADPGAEVRALALPHLGLEPASNTFHGRDVLAPAAGWLAGGRYGFTALGPCIDDPVRTAPLCAGAPHVVHVDAYGNLITNVRGEAVAGCRAVRAGGVEIPLARTYGDVPAGSLLALIGSYGLLEVAKNRGSAAAALQLGRGAPVALVGSTR